MSEDSDIEVMEPLISVDGSQGSSVIITGKRINCTEISTKRYKTGTKRCKYFPINDDDLF